MGTHQDITNINITGEDALRGGAGGAAVTNAANSDLGQVARRRTGALAAIMAVVVCREAAMVMTDTKIAVPSSGRRGGAGGGGRGGGLPDQDGADVGRRAGRRHAGVRGRARPGVPAAEGCCMGSMGIQGRGGAGRMGKCHHGFPRGVLRRLAVDRPCADRQVDPAAEPGLSTRAAAIGSR